MAWGRAGKGKRLIVYLKRHEVAALLNVPVKPRDRLILRLLYYCGMRISEVLGLMLEDVDVVGREIRVCHALTPSGRPKEEKERLVLVDTKTLRLIVEYAGSKTEGRLFHLTIRQAQRLVKQYAREAGIHNWKRVTPHKLRHSFATHYYRSCRDLIGLQQLLGHSKPETTGIYADMDLEACRQHYDAIFNKNNSKRPRPAKTIDDLYKLLQSNKDALKRLEKRLDELIPFLRNVGSDGSQ